MCGICGLAYADASAAVDRARLDAMTEALRHRGPDEGDVWIQRNVGLGARRLSIIDVAHGHQPMANEDASCVVAFNGEIYNASELRRELEGKGYAFRTQCDTEVVLRAYEAWDEEAVQRFNGMFAFAVWDAKREQVYLARDRVGIKPLVYLERDGRFAFSSELDSLAQSELIAGRINAAALDAYFTYLYVPHPDTIFEGVHKLGPGEALIWQHGQLRKRVYWRPAFNPTDSWRLETAAEAYTDLLHDAVRLRMVSDVPLGAFLSGGVDSTSVVWCMSEQSSGPVKTFTIGFGDAEADERMYARHAAGAFMTDHTERVMEADLASMSADLVRHFGEPFADSSAIPTWLVSKLAREQVTVALSGDGGDELFAGYTWLHMTRRVAGYRRMPDPLRRLAGIGLWLTPRSPWWNKVRRFQQDAWLSPMEAFRRRQTCYSAEQRARLYGDSAARAVEQAAVDRFREHWDQCTGGSDEDAMLCQDLRMYLPDDILTKVDRMSMAASLEARVPLLDHRIVEFAGSVPFPLKYNGGASKRLAKEALRGHVPDVLLWQRKRGFAIPVHRWFREELGGVFRDGVLERGLDGWLNLEAARDLFGAHQTGRADYGHHLWALLVFEHWRRYAEKLPGVSLSI